MIIIFKSVCQRCNGVGFLPNKGSIKCETIRCDVCDGEGNTVTIQGEKFFRKIGQNSAKVICDDLRKS
jgi:DnaJ-class molecular chaperone